MDIHDLRAFKAVYEHQSLAEAAKANFVTRQALSKTILHLEAELGSLFIRKAMSQLMVDFSLLSIINKITSILLRPIIPLRSCHVVGQRTE